MSFARKATRTASRVFALNQNPAVVNAGAADFQKIRTAEFTVPVIRADVLVYQPGELGTGTEIGRNGAKVYYSEESLKDPEFLETVRRSPISVGTHEKNTGEFNREIDGWIVDAWYDDNAKAVLARGYVAGEENVRYVEQNKSKPGFGTSAYIEFLDVKRAKGIAPTGAEYDAMTTKLVNNHLAILPNIRDKKNVILALNALSETDAQGVENNSDNEKGKEVKNMDGKPDKEAVKEVLNELEKEKAENDWKGNMENSIKGLNEKLECIMSKMAKNEEPAKEEPKKEEAPNNTEEDGANAEEPKDEEAANAKNALASQELIRDAAEILGVTYTQTPTVMQIASAFGVKKGTFAETVMALNAKRAELRPGAMNAQKPTGGFDDFLSKF